MKNQNVLTKTIAACLFLLSYAPTVPAENSKLTFTTGLDYSTGKYGKSEKTEKKGKKSEKGKRKRKGS